jgi:hypothetical protein
MENSAQLKLPERVKISDDVLFQEMDGESVLLDLTNEQYFGLNEVGTRIWQLLSENGETVEVLSQLTGEFDADEQILQRDLALLLNELEAGGLIVIEA